jgi:hypothetical protein
MPKQEILPPVRYEPVGTPKTTNMFGWGRQSRTKRQLAFYQNQTQLIEHERRFQQEIANWQEDGERRSHDLQLRRIERDETHRQSLHDLQAAEMRRATELEHHERELINAKTERALAQIALLDAEQQLAAQRDLGEIAYRIVHQKKHHELLDLDMMEADKRAVLNEPHSRQPIPDDANDELIAEALAYYKEQLTLENGDTRRIDAELKRRGR